MFYRSSYLQLAVLGMSSLMLKEIRGLFSFNARPLSSLIIARLNIKSLYVTHFCYLQIQRGLGEGIHNYSLQ
jgi:hypothetical protein